MILFAVRHGLLDMLEFLLFGPSKKKSRDSCNLAIISRAANGLSLAIMRIIMFALFVQDQVYFSYVCSGMAILL